MKKHITIGLTCLVLLVVSFRLGATTASYNATVQIVDSLGNVLGGVASAVTAAANYTVRVVDSNGKVLDSLSSGLSAASFCDGSDGAATITGGTTTLTSDKQYTTLHVTGTGVLITNGWRVFAHTSITVDSGGVIHNDGLPASGQTAGAGSGDGLDNLSTLGKGDNGRTGGAAGAPGSDATCYPNSYGGTGGAGGNGDQAGGAASGAPTIPDGVGNPHQLHEAVNGYTLPRQINFMQNLGTVGSIFMGGCQAGSGGGGVATTGGGSGAGGGVMLLVSPTITNNGRISANGGNGGNAVGAGNGGGGAGAPGGLVMLVYNTYTGNAAQVNPGTPGNGTGTGVAGHASTAGLVIQFHE